MHACASNRQRAGGDGKNGRNGRWKKGSKMHCAAAAAVMAGNDSEVIGIAGDGGFVGCKRY